jgi:crossover junction endodeoxyribonuclease RuvC
MSVLTLDLGTQTGWAIHNQEKNKTQSGTVSFQTKRHEGAGMRFLQFRRWLDSLGDVTEVYFEEVRRHAGTTAAHVYGGFMATLTAWCESRGVPYSSVPGAVIKKSATGKGNANKAAVIAAMRKAGHNPADDNEADALALLLHVSGQGGC